jgi:hypothetical protein
LHFAECGGHLVDAGGALRRLGDLVELLGELIEDRRELVFAGNYSLRFNYARDCRLLIFCHAAWRVLRLRDGGAEDGTGFEFTPKG